ncbi:TPA: hypothetical protein RQK83_000403 [Vibrio vulnificus]|nr:hypothetical protein [Vibrio vulnificus]HDY8054009.1 hypothetical protein [Vibrio vulnificus]
MSNSNLERFMEMYEASAKDNDKFARGAVRRWAGLKNLESTEPTCNARKMAQGIAREVALLCATSDKKIDEFKKIEEGLPKKSEIDKLKASVEELKTKFEAIKATHEALNILNGVGEISEILSKKYDDSDKENLKKSVESLSVNKYLNEVEHLSKLPTYYGLNNLIPLNLMPNTTVKDYLAHTSVNKSMADAFRSDWANVGSELWRSYYKIATEQVMQGSDNSDRDGMKCR